jgi:hypothetical protein
MLDDTCYLLGFDSFTEAAYVHYLLNSKNIQNLLDSLVFWEGKRVITKEILMRLDYGKLLSEIRKRDLPLDSMYDSIVPKQEIEAIVNLSHVHSFQRKPLRSLVSTTMTRK